MDSDNYAFAASGTCLRTEGTDTVYITLGNTQANIVYSFDKGDTWGETVTDLQSGDPSAGLFSVDFKNETHGILVGGDYR